MKNKIIAALSLVFATIACVFCLAFGTVDDTGPTFGDYTRTNRWSWSTNLGAPIVITIGGTNLTSITTNIDFQRAGITNTLKIVNGIVMGIQ